MARIPVAELRVQTQGPGLVRVTASAPARQGGGDIREWVQRSGMRPRALVMAGLALAAVGGVGALLISPGFFGMVAFSSMFTVGGGLAFLGMLKRKPPADEQRALPPASSATVIAERARRVQTLLEQAGDHTFERLMAQLRWTEPALLETLLAMKDSGQLIEDLDLDTGEWIYRSALADYGTAGAGGAMTLADRRARGLHTETNH